MAQAAEKTESKQDVPVTQAPQEVEPARQAQALSPLEEMDRFFEGFMPRSWMRSLRREWPSLDLAAFEGKTPRVDVIDRDDAVVVRAEVPGVKKDDLDVSMTDSTVTIKGSTRREEKQEKGDFYRCEMTHGSFARTVALPSNVDGSKAEASFKNGVLEMTIPKVEKAKRRTIKVK